MNFAQTFEFLVNILQKAQIDFALIGGLALQAVGVTRSTRDVDLLILAKDKDAIKNLMAQAGYRLLHESADVLNFINSESASQRVDFLLAHRRYALEMLRCANDCVLNNLKLKVLRPEDLIGLKVQASHNDPERAALDKADIQAILLANQGRLNTALLREYFQIFNREQEFNELIKNYYEPKP